jgi:Methylase involved in ubiquinone/menaquinone biosynthesis
MNHKFNVESCAKLDNQERRRLLPPERILNKFGLLEGDIVADIGCGIGYFTLPASIIVGSDGKIFAMDISDEMLLETREKAYKVGATNIETIRISEHSFLLPDNSVDVGIIFFVLHEAEDPGRFLTELHRIIRPGGKVALIDWEKQEMPQGPPIIHRISEDEAASLLQKIGFTITKVNVGENFYGFLGVKCL